MVFGRSGGVRGVRMDHTKRFPRTLAGFGLTWHGGSRFSCFLEILETHFITKYLQIGTRASRLVLGFFWKPGHQIKPINFPKNDAKQTYFPGTWSTSQNRHLLTKWLPLFCLLLGPMPLLLGPRFDSVCVLFVFVYFYWTHWPHWTPWHVHIRSCMLMSRICITSNGQEVPLAVRCLRNPTNKLVACVRTHI